MEKHAQNLEYEEGFVIAKPVNLELTFLTKVASPVYTGRTITGQDGCNGGNGPIKVILVDSKTRQQVTNRQAASLKVNIVLIRAEFCGPNGDEGIWTPQEFKNNIVVNFGKKKNLLLGDLTLTLKEGSGTLGEIRFKHDSNPIRNVKFRLGAMVDDDCPYAIKESITHPFDVKDRRNESKSTGPLLPNDMVWKLVNIGKKGPIRKRLERKNVATVRDFLDMHYSNPQALKEICGIKGKKWEMMVSHAKTSRIDDMCNVYERVGSTSQQSNKVTSIDYNDNIMFDCSCYKPQVCEHDSVGNMLIMDCNFSIQDVERGEVVILGMESYQDHPRISDASKMDGGGPAKKRWMKLRATLWFSRVGVCVCA